MENWRLIKEGQNTRWSLSNLIVNKEQYFELLILRNYLLHLRTKEGRDLLNPMLELQDLCLMLELSDIQTFMLNHTHSERCSKLPLCSLTRELDLSPRLIWIEHYICLYEQHHSLLKLNQC